MNLGLRQLIDRTILTPIQDKSARLLTKAALFMLAAFAFLIGFIFLTAAFFIWVVQLAGPLVAALSVAGFYVAVGIIAVLIAIYGGREKVRKPKPAASQATSSSTGPSAADENRISDDEKERAAVISEAVVPLIEVLRSLGWKREELALLAAAELAKKLPPLTLVGLAIICGFLIGRLYQLPVGLIPKKAA
jgi:hypothetical protein